MDNILINIVYAHLKPDFISAMKRGNIHLIYSARPILGSDMYVYWDAFSFSGRQDGLNVLLLMEPSVVLPGQYNEELWKQFDHVFTLYDAIIEKYGFTKYLLTRQGFHPWFGESEDTIVTEDLDERRKRYPLDGRKDAICLINGNKFSSVPGELYSKRIEAALWFSPHTRFPLDVYGFLPFFLPNYKGQVENNRKLFVVSQYKYFLCFENTGHPLLARGYVDKILDPLEARTVPIYLGCPNIEDYIPPSCFVDFRDFNTYEDLDAYLKNMPEREYLRYIDNIDGWVNAGGLRPYSWYPLYDNLVKYLGLKKGIDPDMLFGNDATWKNASFTGDLDFSNAKPLCTFDELANTASALIDSEDNCTGIKQQTDTEHLARAIDLAKKGFYREALESMAWIHFYRNPDLFCFYARILHLCGYYDAEFIQLNFALHLDSNHIASKKQLISPCTPEHFPKAIEDFERMLDSRVMGKEMTKGMISVILSVSDIENSRQCLEMIKTGIPVRHEILLLGKNAPNIPLWLKKLFPGDEEFTILESLEFACADNLNTGIKAARGEYILIIDPCAFVLPDTVPNMLECLTTSDEHGLAVPMCNNATGTQQIPKAEAWSFEEFSDYAKTAGARNSYHFVPTFEIDYPCVLIKRAVFERIGMLKQHKTPYHTVNDFRMRALIEGKLTIMACNSYIYFDSRTNRVNEFDPVFNMQWDTFNPNSETGRKLLPIVTNKNARDKYRKGLLDEAFQAIMDGLKLMPDESSLYYCLADILTDAKLHDKALEALESVPEHYKGTLRAIERFAVCHYNLGNIADAQEYIDKALAISTKSAKAINLAGLIAFEVGNDEKARAFFGRAIAEDPGFADPYMNLGIMQWQKGEENKALEFIEKAFILSPETTDFSTNYYSAITSLSQFGRAENIFLEAVGLFPLNKKLFFYYIGTLLQQGNLSDAMAQTEKAMMTFGIDDGILAAALQIREQIGPMMFEPPGRRGSLSVCMIVKNEEDKIARCLATLKPVADEIIVADTGSDDRTKDIARAFGAQVFDFPWTDDFSEARNFSMARARAPWVLVHDADEVISPRDYDKLRAVLDHEYPKPVAFSLLTRNYSMDSVYDGWVPNQGEYPDEEAGTGWFPSPKVRLVMNDERFRFENPIHELLEPSLQKAGVEIRSCEMIVHHYGQTSKERSDAKSRMYYELGKKKLEMEGDTEASLRELAVQARGIARYDEAIELWKRYIPLNPGSHLPFFNMSACYFELGQFDNAYRVAEHAFKLNPASKEAVQCYAAASLFRDTTGEAKAALEALLRNIPTYPTGKATLGAAYLVSGEKEKGIKVLQEMKSMSFDCSEMLYSLSEKLASANRISSAILLLGGMLASGHTHPDTSALLEKCRGSR
ncbi:MAG: glycosyltransferase [Syntrophorhabdaceae bacterium]